MKKVHISAATAAILALLTLSSEVSATDIASPAYVKSGDAGIAPALFLSYGSTNYWDMAGGPNNYRIYDHINGNPVFIINASSSNSNSLVVDTAGDIGLANDAVHIDKGARSMGIGTNNPQTNLHIVSHSGIFNLASANVKLEANSDVTWTLGSEWYSPVGTPPLPPITKQFFIKDDISSTTPFVINTGAPDDSLNIASDGKIGLGTDTPSAKLDVNGTIQSSLNGPGTESVYKLLTLSANDTDGDGPSEAAFVLRNEKAGQEWLFRTIDDGTAFTATLGGTGGPEFKVVSDEGDYTKTKLYIGGKLVFANGKIQSDVLP